MSIIKVRNELGEFVEIPTLQGPQGDTGIGIPTGGTTGQILSKNSDSDYDTRWIDNNISAFENDVNYINSIGPSKDRIKSIQIVDTLPEIQEPNVLYLVKQNDTPSVEYDTSPVMELGTISRSTGATDESVDDIRTKDYVYIGGIKSLTINNGLNKTSRVHLYDKDKVYITDWYEEAGVKYSYRSIENGSPLTNIPSNAVYMKFKISYNQVKDVEVSYEV